MQCCFLPACSHTNGVAIYYHKDNSPDALDGVGGEYMASSIVRGSPQVRWAQFFAASR